MSETLTNIPEYTVSEISGAVKRTLEDAFGRVRVRGEVTGFKRYASGHFYYGLKDAGGCIDAVTWKTSVSRLGLKPEDGVEVIATGRLTTHGERSKYQLVVERLEYAGVGALLARIEALRLKLAAEGLFDAARKRAWPVLPGVVGVVTSPSGAVLHDIRTTILRRFPRPILLWPVPVQGEGAADKLAAAIAGFDAIEPGGAVPRPDVLIVARGGGSVEDLMAFNDEAVVRAAASCRIPLISAVGHETDHTLIDLVADRRAPTPTAAAELAVPARAELMATVAHEASRLASALARSLREGRLHLNQARLPDLPGLLGLARQRLDDRALRLDMALPNLLTARRASLSRAERAIPDPHRLVLPARGRMDLLSSGLAAGLRHAVGARHAAGARTMARLTPGPVQGALREARTRFEGASALLNSVSYEAVLRRGYVLVFDGRGRPIPTAASIVSGAALRLRFADGETAARAIAPAAPARQGRLVLE